VTSREFALGPRACVLSPHLDDAVLSLGAAIACAAREGAEVTVLTVLAGDPLSDAPAGTWDRRAGFRTAGEAARARAEEDRQACTLLGATPVHLRYSNRQDVAAREENSVWSTIDDAMIAADVVLIPGFPLAHGDHAWLSKFVRPRAATKRRIVSYMEQPYALWAANEGRSSHHEEDFDWVPVRASGVDRRAKLAASLAYRSQIPLLGGTTTIMALIAHETRQGGELVSP
jgi:LmbE family N-acetylglucosaminyl deacetylase